MNLDTQDCLRVVRIVNAAPVRIYHFDRFGEVLSSRNQMRPSLLDRHLLTLARAWLQRFQRSQVFAELIDVLPEGVQPIGMTLPMYLSVSRERVKSISLATHLKDGALKLR